MERGIIEFEFEDMNESVGVIARWFGIPLGFFDDYRLVRTNTKGLHIVNADIQVENKPKAESIGLPFVHTNMAVWKLTQPASLFLGPHCTRNLILLDRAQACDYLARKPVVLTENNLHACDGPGYVMVRFDAMTLGLAFRHRDDPMELQSMVPKAWATADGVDPF